MLSNNDSDDLGSHGSDSDGSLLQEQVISTPPIATLEAYMTVRVIRHCVLLCLRLTCRHYARH